MPDPASLTPGAVDIPDAEILEAIVNDDAAGPDDLVRCEVRSFGRGWVTDPMPWDVHFTPDGFFYPKRGDRAKVSANGDGPGVVLWWQQSADAEPDATF